MRKLYTALALFMLAVLPGHGQTTTITATIPAYANGTAVATFNPGGAATPFPRSVQTTIDAGGSFSLAGWNNATGRYAPSSTTVNICAGSAPSICYQTTFVAGATTRDVTALLANAPVPPTGGGGAIVFPTGILHGNNTTAAPTAADSTQMQTAIGAGVYDASGAAAAALTAAEAYSSNADNISAGTLGHARLPALLSGDIPNNAANTSGNAGTATALAGTPSNCTAGNSPTGILPNGNATGCQSVGGSPMTWPLAPGIAVCTGTPCTAWGASLVAPTGALVGTSDTQSLLNKTVDGVTPTVMAFVDPTSSIQTQINSKGNGTVNSGTAPIIVSGAAASCPTCAIQGDQTVVGGILGGYHGNATNSATIFPFGISGGNWVAQTFTAWYRDLAIVTSTAQAAGEWHIFSFAEQFIGGGTTGLPQFAVAGDIQSGAAAGVYSSNISNASFPVPARTAGAVKIAGANASAVFRGYAWDLVGSTSQPLGWAVASSVSANSGQTIYVSPSQPTGIVTTEALQAVVVPYTSTAKNLCVSVGATQPATGTLVFTLRKNGTTNTSLVATVAVNGTSGLYCDTADTVALTAGDWVTISVINNASTAASNITTASFELVPSGSATGMIIFPTRGLTFSSGSAQFAAPFAAPALQTTEALQRAPMPRSLTMKNLSCIYTTPPGTSSIVATVMQNGSATALTVSIPTTGSGTQMQTDSTHTVSFAALDTFDLQFNQASGTSPIISACSVEVD